MKALSGLVLSCASAWSAAGCENQSAPAVQGEPSKVQGVQAAESPRAVQPSAQLDLAKYEGSTPSGTAPAAAPIDKAALALAPSPSPASAAGAAPAAQLAAPSAQPLGAGPRQGGVVNDEAFSTWLEADSPVAAGSKSHVEAVLVAKAPYHCNAEYPHKFKLNAAPAGLSYPEDTVRGMQVTAERGVLRIPVQAQNAGPATVSGTLSFSVCTEERCLVEKRDLSLNLEVK
jgi:hypothetical protein